MTDHADGGRSSPLPVDEPALEDATPDEQFQLALIDMEEPWREAWRGMPEFTQEDQTPWKSVLVHFESQTDMAAFAKLLGQTVLPTTRSLWYPEAAIGHMTDKRYSNED